MILNAQHFLYAILQFGGAFSVFRGLVEDDPRLLTFGFGFMIYGVLAQIKLQIAAKK